MFAQVLVLALLKLGDFVCERKHLVLVLVLHEIEQLSLHRSLAFLDGCQQAFLALDVALKLHDDRTCLLLLCLDLLQMVCEIAVSCVPQLVLKVFLARGAFFNCHLQLLQFFKLFRVVVACFVFHHLIGP